MALDDTSLRTRAQHTYERGRLMAALRSTWFLPPLLALSLWNCGTPGLTCAAGAAALALAIVLEWRGRDWAQARRAGVLAGLVPFALPLVARGCGHPCSGSDCAAFLGTAVAGGLIAGAFIGLRSSRPQAAVLGLLLAGLIGSLGCALAGLMGLAAMGGALVVSSVPVFLIARATRPA